MADTVASYVLQNTPDRYVVYLTGLSDGTGEDAIKVDRSGLAGPANGVPDVLAIESIEWASQGYTSLTLYWEYAAGDVTAAAINGNGCLDFSKSGGGYIQSGTANAAATDGDIKLVTVGHTAGDTYNIILSIKKIEN